MGLTHNDYTLRHPELRDILSDYLQILLHRKPKDVWGFTREYYGNQFQSEGVPRWPEDSQREKEALRQKEWDKQTRK